MFLFSKKDEIILIIVEGMNVKLSAENLGNVKYIFDTLIIGISLWSGCHFNAKIYGILLGKAKTFQKFKQRQN